MSDQHSDLTKRLITDGYAPRKARAQTQAFSAVTALACGCVLLAGAVVCLAILLWCLK